MQYGCGVNRAEGEIRRFVERDYQRVVGLVALIAGSRPLAEDTVQEALARAWVQLRRDRPIDSMTPWVTAVALNLARSGLRRRRAEARAYERIQDRGSPAASGVALEEQWAIANAIRALPRRQREVVVLRHQFGYDTSTTASILRVSEGTVKSALHRAHRSLAETLETTIEVKPC
jgi:RNA polymerase sigma factor (sigma-70 family)